MPFPSFLSYIRPQLEKRIIYNISFLFENIVGKDNANYQFKDSVRKYMLGGKFFRSTLLIYMYMFYTRASKSMLQNIDTEILDVAVSLEFLQAYLLMHDDVMDADELRRGEPSFHVTAATAARQFFTFHFDRDSSVEYNQNRLNKLGESLAICMGNLLYSFSIEILKRAVKPQLLPQIIYYFTNMVSQVSLAQMDDVTWTESSKEPSFEEIQKMYEKKTGVYTFSLPMIMGFLLAESSVEGRERELENLYELGKLSGILFQIQDDKIELQYDSSRMGKPSGSDIFQVKKTYVRALLLAIAKEKNREEELHAHIEEARKNTDISKLSILADELELWHVIDADLLQLQQKMRICLEETYLTPQQKNCYDDLINSIVSRKL